MWTSKEELLKALQLGDNNAFRYLYQKYYYMVEGFVLKNGGEQNDAKEIFQDAIFVVYKKLKENGIESITVEVSTFLFAVSKNLWLNKCRKNSIQPTLNFGDADPFEKVPDISIEESEWQEDNEEKLDKIKEAMEKISSECREIIMSSYYKKLETAQIAANLGYSIQFVKVKKHRCMEMLKQLIFQK